VKVSHTMTDQMSGLWAVFCMRWPAYKRLLKGLICPRLSTRLWRFEFDDALTS